MDIPDGQLIDKYVEIRAHIKSLEDLHDKALAPYKGALGTIEAAFMARMNERQVNSIAADGGTAYRSTVLSVRTADKLTFIDWVKDNNLLHDMDVRPSKETVKTWMDEHDGTPPPGVDVATIHKINFRRS